MLASIPVMVVGIVGATLALVAFMGNLMADKCATARTHSSANKCALAAAGKSPNTGPTRSTDGSPFAGSDAAGMVPRIVVKVGLGQDSYCG